MCHLFGLGREQSQLSSPRSFGFGRFSRSSQCEQGSTSAPAEGTSAEGSGTGRGLVGRIVGGVTKIAPVAALTLAMVLLAGSDAMAQTPTPPPDPGSIPVFVDFTQVIGKITEGLATFVGPVLVFMAGIAIVLMFATWTVGRRRVG